MKSDTTIKTNKKQDSRWNANGISEALLRSEICFWKDLIAGSEPAQTQESLERMLQAQALAESRLLALICDHQHAHASDTLKTPPSNVYSISCSSASRARNSKLPGLTRILHEGGSENN